jgi:apolipoprotein N-acyltransferase
MAGVSVAAISRSGLAAAGDWLRNLAGYQRMAAGFAAGVLSALGFAPIEFFPALLFGYAALVLLLDGAFAASHGRVRKFALIGWAFGFGQFLFGLYWIGNAFMVDVAAHAWQIPFVLILLPGGLALFPALACAAVLGLWQQGSPRILALTATLALSEWLRGHVLTGFPWNLAAYGWGAVPEVMQSAAVVGSYGLTLLTILLGASLAELFARGRPRAYLLPGCMVVLFGLIGLWGGLRLAGDKAEHVPNVRLRIVQPNIPEREKFDPAFTARNWQRLVALSLKPDGPPPTHIIWPESAPPFLLMRTPAALADVAAITGNNRVLLTGAARMTIDQSGQRRFFNSFFVFGPGARVDGIYDKFHLVPFGEYLPLESFFHALGIDKLVDSPGGFSSGPGPRTLAIPGAPDAGPLICYEIIFPDAVVGNVRPDWLINVTNDSWFGTWSGPHQHFLIARMRAIEEGLPVIRAAATGISAVIDSYGGVEASLALDQTGVIDAKLPVARAPTLYAINGDLYFAAMLVVSATFAGWWLSKK